MSFKADKTNPIVEVLMRRDGMSEVDACEMVQDAHVRILSGEDPDDILHEEFGLEPDYIFDLL